MSAWFTTLDLMVEDGVLNEVSCDTAFFHLSQMEKWNAPPPVVSSVAVAISGLDGPRIDLGAINLEWEGEDNEGSWTLSMVLHPAGTLTDFFFCHWKKKGDVIVAPKKTYPFAEGMVLLMRWLPISGGFHKYSKV